MTACGLAPPILIFDDLLLIWGARRRDRGEEMEFEWDEKKNRENIKKHGVSFKRAAKIFSGHVLEWIDGRRDYGEERIIALGRSERTILYVVYTMRGRLRIISARRSTKDERRKYLAVYP